MHIPVPKILLQAKGAMKQGSNQFSRDLRLQRRSSSDEPMSMPADVPKGHLAVYVGNGRKMNRFVIPIAYLKQPLFQGLLRKAEEEFGFEHPMGGLTLPCSEDDFLSLISHLSGH